MSLNTYVAKSVAIAMTMALAGCGGGDSSSDTTPPPQPPPKPESKLLALDGFSTVKPDTKTRVNLSSFVRGDNVKIVSANVEGDDSQCGVPTVDGTSLDITAGNGAYCSYSYLARSGEIQSSALLRVLATDAAVPMLPPVSQAMVLGGSNLSLNLETLLGSDWPTGYQLNSSPIKVQGSEGNLGSIVSTTGNTVVYKGPELSGWNRLVYTISNPVKPGEDKMGTVYITVSEQMNQPPHIGSPKYTYTGNVVASDNIVMNLALLSGLDITEPDSQEWQLIDVQSFTATVTSTNPDSVTNKSFNFNAGTVGEHYVSYIIADHFDGYATGLIKVNVQAKGGKPTWTAITHDGISFTAPQTYTKAQSEGVQVASVWDEGVANTIAGYSSTSASHYCNSVGGVPTQDNLVTLRNGFLTSSSLNGELAKWPALKPYLVRDGSGYKGFDLSTGLSSAYSYHESYYVTCKINPDLYITDTNLSILAGSSAQNIFKFVSLASIDSATVTAIDGSLSASDITLETTVIDGEKQVAASSLRSGTFFVRVRNDSSSLTFGPVTVNADRSTARPVAVASVNTETITTRQMDRQKPYVAYTYKIVDANGNLIPNANVNLHISNVKVGETLDGLRVVSPILYSASGNNVDVNFVAVDGTINLNIKSSTPLNLSIVIKAMDATDPTASQLETTGASIIGWNLYTSPKQIDFTGPISQWVAYQLGLSSLSNKNRPFVTKRYSAGQLLCLAVTNANGSTVAFTIISDYGRSILATEFNNTNNNAPDWWLRIPNNAEGKYGMFNPPFPTGGLQSKTQVFRNSTFAVYGAYYNDQHSATVMCQRIRRP